MMIAGAIIFFHSVIIIPCRCNFSRIYDGFLIDSRCIFPTAYADVQKVDGTRKIRAGRGKMRNRRYTTRKGPLLVVSKRCEAVKAFRNIPGIDINYVSSLNLLRLAPGGHAGRLIVWTEDAFNQLDKRLKVKEMYVKFRAHPLSARFVLHFDFDFMFL